MKYVAFSLMGFGMLLATACVSSSSGGSSPDPVAPGEKQQLVAKGDCTFEACGSMPSSYEGEAKVECAESSGECSWAPSDPLDTAVSYSPCQDSECPARPDIECPEGSKRSQSCGNENDRGCAWTTLCVPPRETTPCADTHGCDGQPIQEIGIICQDQSVGTFVCVTDGQRCFLERSCD